MAATTLPQLSSAWEQYGSPVWNKERMKYQEFVKKERERRIERREEGRKEWRYTECHPSWSNHYYTLYIRVSILYVGMEQMCYIHIIITRCTYSQCMPRAHLHDLWTNTCGLLLVGVACDFWDGRSCMCNEVCNEVWKVWEGRQSVCIRLKEFENVSVFSNHTERKDMVVSQDDHVLYLLR